MGYLGLTWTGMGTFAHADNVGNYVGRGGNIWKNLAFVLPKLLEFFFFFLFFIFFLFFRFVHRPNL